MNVAQSKPRLLTLEEAAERFNVAEKTVRNWVYQKKIDIVHMGRLVRIKESTVDEFIERNTVKAYNPPTRSVAQ